MDQEPASAPADDHSEPAPAGGWSTALDWARPWLFGLLILAVYLGNRRQPSSTMDTVTNELLPYAMIRGDGPFLDRFRQGITSPDGRIYDYATRSRGRALARHPIGAAVVMTPFIWPQMALLDWARPGWDRQPVAAIAHSVVMVKRAMAVIAALVGVLLVQVLDRLGLRRVALPTALAATLGSDLWAVASQAGWAHGPAALGVVGSLRLLVSGRASRPRLAAAGLTAAALTAVRMVDVVFAAAAALWVLRSRPRDVLWFALPAATIVAALLGYNYWYFDNWAGGQAQLEAMHPEIHGVEGVWTGDLLQGAAGTLLSPSRGLFVFVPWAALAILALPATARRIGEFPFIAWMLCALVPFGLLLSRYSVWWGGHSFGPRYWTEAAPLLAILLGFALDWAWSRSRLLLIPFAAAILWSIALQAVGAFCFPSSWNAVPENVDLHHERLWDWRDNEILRCLREGRKP